MCGIAGYVLARGRETSSARLRAAVAAMRHRGPDDEAIALIDPAAGTSQRLLTPNSDPRGGGGHVAGAVAELAHAIGFGHCRFSIIDTSPGGRQPFWSPDGSVCAAFNGEIYNYIEVREELLGLGRRFRTSSDTEVLVAAFQEWGPGCFARLNGFWAVSLWDARSRRVLLARDRLGKAPLYLWRDDAGLSWASELKALFALNGRARERVNARTIVEFVKFQRRDIHGDTCYEGVTSFPRACHAWVGPAGSFAPVAYWSVPESRTPASRLSVREASENVEHLLRDAVRIRLRADVPVCVQLSGGMDSSSVMALAAQQTAKLCVYTAKFHEKEADEEPYARRAAARYAEQVDYRVITPPDDDLLEHADSYVSLMGEPFHSPNQFTSHRIWNEMHRSGLRVVLYGAGGDEAFAGYAADYSIPFLRELLRKGELPRWLWESLASTEGAGWRQWGDHARRLRKRLGGHWSPPGSVPPPTKGEQDAFVVPDGLQPREGPADDLAGLLRDNMTDWRMSYWLRIDNQNSMGVPVELRCPFLDYRLVEYGFRLPVEYLIRNGWLKWILRKSMERHLPAEIVWRRRKMGFPFPLRGWLLRRKANLLSMLAALDCPFVDDQKLRENYDEMLARSASRLWCILSVALWWKRCVQGRSLASGA